MDIVCKSEMDGEIMNLYEIIGENIRHIREDKQMTRETLAVAVGYSTSYIAKIERGGYGKHMSLLVLLSIAEALQVSPEILVKEMNYDD